MLSQCFKQIQVVFDNILLLHIWQARPPASRGSQAWSKFIGLCISIKATACAANMRAFIRSCYTCSKK